VKQFSINGLGKMKSTGGGGGGGGEGKERVGGGGGVRGDDNRNRLILKRRSRHCRHLPKDLSLPGVVIGEITVSWKDPATSVYCFRWTIQRCDQALFHPGSWIGLRCLRQGIGSSVIVATILFLRNRHMCHKGLEYSR